MKRIIIISFVILVLLQPFGYSIAGSSVLDITVNPFLTALQSGDIASLRIYVGGALLGKMTEAFKQDEAYGDFLKQHYDGALFYPTVIQENENQMTVNVDVQFDKKVKSSFGLYLQKDATGAWWIMDQYSPTLIK